MAVGLFPLPGASRVGASMVPLRHGYCNDKCSKVNDMQDNQLPRQLLRHHRHHALRRLSYDQME
eukprot:1865444-Pyramimonas_sp.AAC.1